jgi:RimJ/RimL family protein N-acetyltransferase
MIVLATRRLRLRPLEASDEALYVSLFTDAGTLEKVGSAQTESAARAGFRATLRRDPAHWPWWVLEIAGTEDSAGFMGLEFKPGGRAEIGAIFAPEFHGMGLAKESAAAVVEYAFGFPGTRLVECTHAPSHPAVEGVMRALGFLEAAPGPPPHPRRWELQRPAWLAHRARQREWVGILSAGEHS